MMQLLECLSYMGRAEERDNLCTDPIFGALIWVKWAGEGWRSGELYDAATAEHADSGRAMVQVIVDGTMYNNDDLTHENWGEI